ncbi:MAG: hypothetical protein JSU86_05730 [Phycisphaerales bacterium]|nr:MAG: hypothetical protein JSU86_05730 [Phycisphaerales bacterium]
MMKFLYWIEPKGFCDVDREWYEFIWRKRECPGCFTMYADQRTQPVDVVVEGRPSRAVTSYARGPMIGLIRNDFLKLLGEEAQRWLHIGRVFDSKTRLIREWSTFIGERPIEIRGGPDSYGRLCEECGRYLYTEGEDPKLMHIHRASLSDQPIYEANAAALLLTPGLYERIRGKKWKGVWITRLPVYDGPLDGIDPFPENYY